MQKFYITDGKRYIKKVGHRYQTVDGSFSATPFALQIASRILDNNLPIQFRKTFYLEGEENFERVLPEEPKGKENEQDSMLTLINSFKTFSSSVTKIPTLKECLEKKIKLSKMLSELDLELSDANHWKEFHSPPADVRCRIWTTEQEILKKRRVIKDGIECVNFLIECYENKYSIGDIKNVIPPTDKTYKPRTEMWETLELIADKKGCRHE